jgi:hypothetical protein
VRRKEKALEDPKVLEGILSQSTICYLALKTKGAPYILPMSYGYAAGVLYFHSAPEGRKNRLTASTTGSRFPYLRRCADGGGECALPIRRSVSVDYRDREGPFPGRAGKQTSGIENTHAPAYRARGALLFTGGSGCHRGLCPGHPRVVGQAIRRA